MCPLNNEKYIIKQYKIIIRYEENAIWYDPCFTESR